jgi:hypothetical protein
VNRPDPAFTTYDSYFVQHRVCGSSGAAIAIAFVEVIVHRAERQVTMKRAIGVAAFILFFALPAHAQRGGAGSAAGPRFAGGGGGGGGFSGGSMGSIHASRPTQFKMTEVHGSKTSFVPSGYLPFDVAVAEGQAILDAQKRSPAEAAAASSIVPKPHAKVAVVQDANGDPIVIQQ